MSKPTNTHLHDVDGKSSAKRKNGTKLLNIAIMMAVIYFVAGIGMALFQKEFKYEFPLEIWWTFMGTGTGLLGITLVERYTKK